jgi:hypothetical protein
MRCFNTGDRYVAKKEAETILKYEDLALEIQRIWNVKTKVITLITVLKGTISISYREYRCKVQGKHEIMLLQKQPYWPLHTYFGNY